MLRHFNWKRRTSRRFRKNADNAIQALESRALLSGTVVVAVTPGGDLTITGDENSNDVSVDIVKDGDTATVTITGHHGTKLKQGSTVNKPETPGGDVSVTVEGVTSIGSVSVSMKGGDDSVELTLGDESGGDFVVNKNVSVDMGDDDDYVSFNVAAGATATVKGDVMVKTGDGDDDLFVNHSGALTLQKGLNVDTGDGRDSVRFSDHADLTVQGDGKITTGDGSDYVGFNNSFGTGTALNFAKSLSIDTGNDSDTVSFGGFETGNDQALSVAKDLSIKTGNDRDSLTIQEVLSIGGKLDINTAGGVDNVRIEALSAGAPADNSTQNTIGGNFAIDSGSDGDQVYVGFNSDFTVKGDMTVSTKEGNDYVSFNTSDSAVAFQKSFKVDTGNGEDDLSIFGSFGSSGGLSVGTDLSITTGNQSDYVSIQDHVNVTGSVTVNTGNGSDFVNISLNSLGVADEEMAVNVIGKDLKIDTGNQSDVLSITADSSLEVKGIVDIKTGGGSDFVSFFADDAVTIDKDVKIDAGASDDHVELLAGQGDFNIGGGLTVTLGNDDDCLIAGQQNAVETVLGQEFVGGSESAVFDVTKDVSVSGGSGDDVIGLAAVSAANVTVDSADGDDVIAGSGLTVGSEEKAGKLTVKGGAGSDNIALQDSEIDGTTSVDAGDGNDRVVVDNVFFNGNISVVMGNGDDQLGIGEGVEVGETVTSVKLDGGGGTHDKLSAGIDVESATVTGFEDQPDAEIDTDIADDVIAAIANCYNGGEEP